MVRTTWQELVPFPPLYVWVLLRGNNVAVHGQGDQGRVGKDASLGLAFTVGRPCGAQRKVERSKAVF